MKHLEYLRKLAQGEWLTLPSGLEVRVKPVDGTILLSLQYTDEVTAVIQQHMTGMTSAQQEEFNKLNEAEKLLTNLKSNRKFGEIVAKNVVLEPVLVDGTPESEDQFEMVNVDSGDLGFLVQLLNMPLASLASFCKKQNTHMEFVLTGEDDPNDAVQSVGSAPDRVEPDALVARPALPLDGTANDAERVVHLSPV